MDYKNKKDNELVELASEGIIGTSSGCKYQGAQLEMMRRLKNSTKASNIIMIILTVVLVVFTGVLIWQGFK